MAGNAGRRTYGSGALEEHRGSWYGRWRVNGRQVRHKIGEIREPGSRTGLSRTQAEAALRRLMSEVRVVVPEERMSFKEADERYLHHVGHVRNRKPSTVQDYRIMLTKHLAPYFGESKAIDRIEARDIARYVVVKASRSGRARRGGNGEEGLSRQDDHQSPQLRARRVRVRRQERVVHGESRGLDGPAAAGAGSIPTFAFSTWRSSKRCCARPSGGPRARRRTERAATFAPARTM